MSQDKSSSPAIFATCDLCDLHKGDTSGHFRVLPPVFRSYGGFQKFSGPVVTVKCFEDNSPVKAAVESPGEARVLVVDGGASLRRALLGGNLGAAAAKNGWAGVVIDGCVRDANLIIELGFPVFCRGLSIKGTGKNQPGKVNVPITLGGVTIRPGEIVVGDRDGLVVVPEAEVVSAIASSLAREEKEAGQRQAIEGGAFTADLLGLADTLRRFGLV